MWRWMASESLKFDAAGGEASPRLRVRTPGKHIVLFALAITFMLALSTTAIRSGRLALPTPDFASGDTNGALYSAPQEFLVDLSPDSTGRSAFLKLNLRLLAENKAALAEIEKMKPQIRERVMFFLRELSSEDFAGTEASARLKAELLKRVRLPVSDGAVADVAIENIVIQ